MERTIEVTIQGEIEKNYSRENVSTITILHSSCYKSSTPLLAAFIQNLPPLARYLLLRTSSHPFGWLPRAAPAGNPLCNIESTFFNRILEAALHFPEDTGRIVELLSSLCLGRTGSGKTRSSLYQHQVERQRHLRGMTERAVLQLHLSQRRCYTNLIRRANMLC